jgi:DNA repair photolyase
MKANAPLLLRKSDDYAYAPITQHDSWLSVDPIVGCRMNCAYCYMQVAGWTGVRPELLSDIESVTQAMLAHRYFVPHETILSFGNHTDPLLPENDNHVLRFITLVDSHGLANPIALVTKRAIPDSFLDALCSLRHVRVIFCISLSGLAPTIERGVDPSDAINNFAKLHRAGQRTIHFWRPLVDQNTTTDVIERVLGVVAGKAAASVYVGLKITPSLKASYRRQMLSCPDDADYGEALSPAAEDRLRRIAADRCPDHPLYRHTSCAVSLVLGIPEYNATYLRPDICGTANCPTWKRRICSRRSWPSPYAIEDALRRIDYRGRSSIREGALVLDDAISQEAYTFLLHRLNIPLRALVGHDRNVWGSIFMGSAI